MPENIVKKIKEAELAAEKLIEAAHKEVHQLTLRATKESEEAVQGFSEGSRDRLKKFREERTNYYKTEATKLEKEGEKLSADYQKSIEAKLPAIKKKVEELVRKELCL